MVAGRFSRVWKITIDWSSKKFRQPVTPKTSGRALTVKVPMRPSAFGGLASYPVVSSANRQALSSRSPRRANLRWKGSIGGWLLYTRNYRRAKKLIPVN